MFDFALLTANFSAAGRRYETLEGKKYLVLPMVMMCEGVHEGSQGPLFYSRDELSKFPGVWDHKPIVVYHPTWNNQPISACDPRILERRKVGIIMNTKFDTKLRAEAWIDEEKLAKVDERVLNAIQGDQMVEVSTGLHLEAIPVANGEWNGETYAFEAKNYRPDHLAILPDQKGACSIEDGAGLLQTNAAAAKSFEETRNAVDEAIGRRYGDASYVVDTFPKTVVFRMAASRELYVLGYSMENGQAVLGNEPPQVVYRYTVYRNADGAVVANTEPQTLRESDMTKKEIIDGLIANAATQWDEADRTFLDTLGEDRLAKMAPVANTEGGTKTTEEKAKDAPAPEEKPAEEAPATANNTAANQPKPPQTVDEYVANAPAGIREILNSGLQVAAAERGRLISTITANSNNSFTEEQLKGKDIVELRQIAGLCQNAQPAAPQPAPFFGVTSPVENRDGFKPSALPLPKMEFADPTKK